MTGLGMATGRVGPGTGPVKPGTGPLTGPAVQNRNRPVPYGPGSGSRNLEPARNRRFRARLQKKLKNLIKINLNSLNTLQFNVIQKLNKK